jgi:hypothetical protein
MTHLQNTSFHSKKIVNNINRRDWGRSGSEFWHEFWDIPGVPSYLQHLISLTRHHDHMVILRNKGFEVMLNQPALEIQL